LTDFESDINREGSERMVDKSGGTRVPALQVCHIMMKTIQNISKASLLDGGGGGYLDERL
jgi:hypothetical protein